MTEKLKQHDTAHRASDTGPSPIELQRALKGVDYPASRQALIEQATRAKAGKPILRELERLPDRRFESPAEVSREIGKMH
ncbi:DUF2795 domain-containing protein [Cupriavidus malaysiensis]|uniref:DUF2795 domain-containing protein n=1 Tax=Cupriavidus malaysiensis TaxID=367825 RepID=A0ABM6FFH1_9BURK|nr:DUF2795 domain-containing protein [Cupriavidus malaysiensis]AOZ10596.1 hypothetical protein BKK80_34215 [Cupriavidus malaysiensis]